MKKEFKAPIIEAKALSAENIMTEAFNSGESNGENWGTYDDSKTTQGFNQWKGLKNN